MHTINILHQNGFRITAQRRAVLDVIAARGGHLTADEIYREARRLNPRISLATVYRTLAVLKENGLIDQHYVSPLHDRAHFEPTCGVSHYHFHCLRCGQILAFQSSDSVAAVLQTLSASEQVGRVERICMCVEGYCKTCAAQQ